MIISATPPLSGADIPDIACSNGDKLYGVLLLVFSSLVLFSLEFPYTNTESGAPTCVITRVGKKSAATTSLRCFFSLHLHVRGLPLSRYLLDERVATRSV